MKIQSLHLFWAPVYGSCLQLWGLGCINNTMIMGNGQEVTSELLGICYHHVVSVLKIDEDTEKYDKEITSEDWRKLSSITVKSCQIFKILGLYCGTVEIFALLWFCMAWDGSWLPMFQVNISDPSSRIWDCFTHADGSDNLFWNVGNHLPTYAEQQSRIVKILSQISWIQVKLH